MTDQPSLSYACLLCNAKGVLQDLTGGRCALELDAETRAMGRGVIALFEAMGDEISRELDPADSATFHQNLARLRELMRESDTPAAHADRPRGAPS